jgi:putative ABC transport system permease protein
VKFDPRQVSQIISQITSVCNQLEPDFPVKYAFVDQEFNQLLASENNLGKLVKFFSLFAVVVLCLGLLGVIMFMAEQKTKEIGVRKCMGEEVGSLVIRFIKPFVVSGLAASLLAIPISWYLMSSWLQNYVNRIDLSIWMFIGSIIFVLVIAIITVSYQSWKAANRNPVEALRYE